MDTGVRYFSVRNINEKLHEKKNSGREVQFRACSMDDINLHEFEEKKLFSFEKISGTEAELDRYIKKNLGNNVIGKSTRYLNSGHD